MEEKKEIKVKLSTVVFLFVIFVLLIALGVIYYFGFVKDKPAIEHTSTNIVEENTTNGNTDQTVEPKVDDGLLTEEEINKKLGNNTKFVIKSIDKDGDDYIISAYLLEKEPRVVTKKEYENLLDGGKIEFRNNDYILVNDPEFDNDNILKSGKKSLTIHKRENKNEYYLDNAAGASIDLCDYSGEIVKFKVKNSILVGNMFTQFKYDDNGTIKAYSYDDLIVDPDGIEDLKETLNSEYLCGSAEDCIVYQRNGIIDAIKMYNS